MDELALGMQVVQAEEDMPETSLEKWFRESLGWIPVEEILPAVPHGLLHQTMMAVIFAVKRENVERCPHMGIAGMRRVCLAQSLVDVELVLAAALPCVHLERHMLMISGPG